MKGYGHHLGVAELPRAHAKNVLVLLPAKRGPRKSQSFPVREAAYILGEQVKPSLRSNITASETEGETRETQGFGRRSIRDYERPPKGEIFCRLSPGEAARGRNWPGEQCYRLPPHPIRPHRFNLHGNLPALIFVLHHVLTRAPRQRLGL